MKNWLAMACVSCAVLLYEIAITRILSVLLWYHFAFLSVSLAMLGLGAPGVWFTLRKPSERPVVPLARRGPGPPARLRRDEGALETSLVLGGVALPVSTVLLFEGSEHVARESSAQIALVVAALLVPLLFLGGAVCLFLMRAEGREVGRMYAADLFGATLGAFLVVPLLRIVPTPHLVAACGFLPLVAAALVARPSRAALGAAVVALCLALPGALSLRTAKVPEARDLLYTKWTPTARLTVFEMNARGFGWGMGSKYVGDPMDQLWIEQDAHAGTPITHLVGAPGDLGFLFYDVTSAGYQVRPPKRACVIGAGGGRDVLTALAAGATDVDAVELNAGMVDTVSGPFGAFSGDVYHLPGVHAVVDEGRSFLTRSRGEYDSLQISLVDTWAATTAGAYALSERYLYTVEAVRLYLQKISARGVISISRWMAGGERLETVRLAQVLRAAFASERISDPRKHVLLVTAGRIGTYLISRAEWSDAEIASVDATAEERGFVRKPIESTMDADAKSYEREGFDLSPSTDDRPFFFQMVSIFGSTKTSSFNEGSVLLLRKLLAVMLALNVLLFFAPLAIRKTARPPAMDAAYFSFIGVAFMLVELPAAQRFVLYLGHPSYATTVVLTCLLLGAGAGSLRTARLSPRAIELHMAALPIAVAVLDLACGSLFSSTLGQSFPVRVALTALVLVPLGYLMGVPLPAGMGVYEERHKPWFWAMNGAASVLAGVLSLALTMLLGFVATTMVGAAFYAIAFAQLRIRLSPSAARPASTEPGG